MNIEFKKSFAKDLRKAKPGQKLSERVQQVIHEVEAVEHIHDIKNLKKLKANGDFYRIRLGDYRLGLIIESDTVTFVRFLHRSDVYRFFP
ncbi:MAG: type II toxin-antitoxin system RelE/ParE family toxin [Desulfobacterales bacterium]|nr:type II toxin-antitoxin system RelE/ParE family toxin [Desulfobacterales bacterium]